MGYSRLRISGAVVSSGFCCGTITGYYFLLCLLNESEVLFELFTFSLFHLLTPRLVILRATDSVL